MPIALAGLASVLWGTADFLGGLAASGWRAERVAAISQVVGLVGAPRLYRSLAIGPMNVAAPTIAVVAAMVPAAIGLVRGERPGALALAGVALAIVAVALVGGASVPGPTEPRPSIRVLGLAVAAGATLGLANVAFAQTSEGSGLWPVTTTKLVAGIVLGSVVLATRTSDGAKAPGRNVRLALWTGLVDVAATTSLALALQRGSLVLVSVLGSLFPAVTVVLARFVLAERIGRVQAVGLALAIGAVAMIVAG